MWRQRLTCCLFVLASLGLGAQSRAAEQLTVRTLVPTFSGSTTLGANVSTILALRLWTTLRPRPNPNPNYLYFGFGEVKWSRRVIEDSPDAATQAAAQTGSDIALWGDVEQYGAGIVATSNLVVPPGRSSVDTRQKWVVTNRNVKLELGLPNVSYQFSPLILGDNLVAKYSRPNQIRVCDTQVVDCNGTALGDPFRSIRLQGDFVLVRQPSGATGWVSLPNLSEAQGEVVDFTAGLISYLRGDFEQAEGYFARVRDAKANSLVRNDAALLAGVSQFRHGAGIEALKSAHVQNPYSQYGVKALVMAEIATAGGSGPGDVRTTNVMEASRLVASYRHLFAPNDPWLVNADRSLHNLN
jgi:hypothetical protein